MKDKSAVSADLKTVPEQFVYFALRVRQPNHPDQLDVPLGGTIEHLARQEKSAFRGLDEMCALVSNWIAERRSPS